MKNIFKNKEKQNWVIVSAITVGALVCGGLVISFLLGPSNVEVKILNLLNHHILLEGQDEVFEISDAGTLSLEIIGDENNAYSIWEGEILIKRDGEIEKMPLHRINNTDDQNRMNNMVLIGPSGSAKFQMIFQYPYALEEATAATVRIRMLPTHGNRSLMVYRITHPLEKIPSLRNLQQTLIGWAKSSESFVAISPWFDQNLKRKVPSKYLLERDGKHKDEIAEMNQKRKRPANIPFDVNGESALPIRK